MPSALEIATSAVDWRDAERGRDVPVKMYVPAGAGPHPVVLFSHGIGENRDSYGYLGRALAGAGFLAVHITHAGTDRAVLEKGYRYLYRAVKQKENWANRSLDISFVLDQLATDGRADMNRVAVAGHSAGAFTAFSVAGLRVAGEEHAMRDERVKVIIPMSMPRMEGIVPKGGYDAIDIPVLNITGTCDSSIIYRTLPRHRREPFEDTRATGHYLLTFDRVNHDTFSSTADAGHHHALIAEATIAFLRGFLLGDTAARRWFEEAGSTQWKGTELTIERK